MRLVKTTVSIFLLLIIICILAAGALILFVDPNKLKPVIISEINKQTGYQAVIDGNLTWSFYPSVGVKVEHMTLTAPQQTTAFVDVRGMTIATSLSQLLRGTELLEGNVRIATIKMMNLQAQDARLNVHWRNNILTLQPITASIYNGTCAGEATGRTLSVQPTWDWQVTCQHVQVKPLLQALSGGSSKINISGDGQLQFKGQTQGKNRAQLMQQLTGISTISISKGALEGIDLNYFIQAATAFLTHQPVPTATNQNTQTSFDSMTGTAVIKNGVATMDNLLLVSPVFATKGTGSIDLVNQKIDYELEATPLRIQKIRWMIPVQITGDLQNPSVRLDTLKLNTLLANEEFDKVKTKVKEEIKKLPERADKLIKHLFGS